MAHIVGRGHDMACPRQQATCKLSRRNGTTSHRIVRRDKSLCLSVVFTRPPTPRGPQYFQLVPSKGGHVGNSWRWLEMKGLGSICQGAILVQLVEPQPARFIGTAGSQQTPCGSPSRIGSLTNSARWFSGNETWNDPYNHSLWFPPFGNPQIESLPTPGVAH